MSINKELFLGISFATLVLSSVLIIVIKYQSVDYKNENFNSMSIQDSVDTNIPKNYSLSEVASHSSPEDCWIIINNNIYDLSDYSSRHPGGKSSIEINCGKDATSAFEQRGGKGPHPDKAIEGLNSFLIGEINE